MPIVISFAMLSSVWAGLPEFRELTARPTAAERRDIAYRAARWRRQGTATLRRWGVDPDRFEVIARALAESEVQIAKEFGVKPAYVWPSIDERTFAVGADPFNYPAMTDVRLDARTPRRFHPERDLDPLQSKREASFPEYGLSATMRREDTGWRAAHWAGHPLVKRATLRDETLDPAAFAAAAAAFERAMAADLGILVEWVWEASAFWINPARARAWDWQRRFPELPSALERYYWDNLNRLSAEVTASLRAEMWILNRGDAVRLNVPPGDVRAALATTPKSDAALISRLGLRTWRNARLMMARDQASVCDRRLRTVTE